MTAETHDLAWACAGTAVIACQPFLILFFLFRKSLNAKAGFVAAASVGFVAMSTALFGAIAANSLSFSFLQLWKLVLVPPSFVVFYLLIRDRTPKILFFSAIVAAVIATTTKMGNYIALRFFEGSLYAGLAAAYVAVHILFTPPIMLYLDRIIQRTGGALEEYGKPIWKTIWIVPAVFLLINLLTNPRFDPDVSVTASFLIANAATVFGLLASCYVLFRAMGIADDAAQIQERARMAARQLDMQREQYERMAQDAEATKKMRHDLRHHLAVIGRLAEEGDAEKVKGYVDDLAGRAIALQEKTYCKNYAANAVAAHYPTG